MVGAGQLARMSQAAAIELGIELRVLGTSPEDPAASAVTAFAEPDDLDALAAFARDCDVLTFDHEGTPADHVIDLRRRGQRVQPGPEALLMAQDKLHARERLAALGAPVPPFAAVSSPAELEAFAAAHGWPLVLKARRGGYDGRGIVFTASLTEAVAVIERGGEWIAEPQMAIDAEAAQVLARNQSGEIELYPLVRTVQEKGICVETRFPAEVDPALEREARELATRIAEAIDAVGILAVELFVADGRLLVNELALRTHNTGHWSIEGCETSQFENHLRAVLGWPLGSAAPTCEAAVRHNVLGAPEAAVRVPAALAVPGAHPHIYGKAARPGRKVAHVTATGPDLGTAAEQAHAAAAELGDRGPA
jgi:5-(carboxyamino)imidazole ribonucleotide synthase